MEIKNIEIKYFEKSEFIGLCNENIKHVKVLPYLSIVQSTEGSYDITLGNNKSEETEQGGFFIAPSNIQQTIIHHVNKQSGYMSARWIFLDVEINKTYRLDTLFQFPLVIKGEKAKELNALFDLIFHSDDIWEINATCFYILKFIITLSAPLENKFNRTMEKVVSYIKDNYYKHISINTLSKIACMSESNFYAVFKKQFGTSPIAFLNHYRLTIATQKLTQTHQSINEICNSIGIEDALYFSKLFKKTYGIPPKEYRTTYNKL